MMYTVNVRVELDFDDDEFETVVADSIEANGWDRDDAIEAVLLDNAVFTESADTCSRRLSADVISYERDN